MKLVGVLIGLLVAIATIAFLLPLGLIFDFDKLEEHHGIE